MFKKFRELFGSENLLDTAFSTTLKMLEFDNKMYLASKETLREKDNAELSFDVRKTDRKINKFEREVRRNVLTHLSIAGTQNIVPGLVLISIVIDVERIGDYTKNIAGLASTHKVRLSGGKYEKDLKKIEKIIKDNFEVAQEVLLSQDKKTARKIMQLEEGVGKIADNIVNKMILNKDKNLNTSDSVTLAMYARYLKRINAHLTNISSAIVNPFPRIGFREKKK
ncbi:MAG: PhoU domain-containing protein [candidate division Zixibacteria bacterium]|nr:PhoU domain-containing protein [candidate division Zixibacteria bacterium]